MEKQIDPELLKKIIDFAKQGDALQKEVLERTDGNLDLLRLSVGYGYPLVQLSGKIANELLPIDVVDDGYTYRGKIIEGVNFRACECTKRD